MIDLKRKNGENEEQFIWRLGQAKDSGLLNMDWNELAGVINREFRADESEYRTEAAYRKSYSQAKRFFGAGVFDCGEKHSDELLNQKRELERLKIQLRDERSAWQKQNYIQARVEAKLDLLEKELLLQGRVNFNPHDQVNVSSDNDMLIILSDFHIGQTFNSFWGEYNTDIAKKRLAQLLGEVIAIQKTHNSEKCYVSLQGDLLSGNIHKTIQVTNRENVIEQIKIASELISSFCYELSKYFNTVFMSSVSGNHSRIDKKEEALHDERLDDLIAWGVELSLKHIENFHVLNRKLDNGIADMNIRGKTYIAVHGDYDRYDKSGVANLCTYLGFVPYAVLFGHLHTCAFDENNGVKMIRGGSLAGSGDNHTIERRLSGRPSQMVCICNSKGVLCCYPVELD